MNLEAALGRFKDFVVSVTGDFVTFDKSTGHWSRKMKPWLEINSVQESNEAIIVKAGEIKIQHGFTETVYHQGDVAFLKRGRRYKIQAGEYGADIEYKFS